MNDDFNTPEAYSVLFEMAREINRIKTVWKHWKSKCSRCIDAWTCRHHPVFFIGTKLSLKGDAAGNDDEVAEIEGLACQAT